MQRLGILTPSSNTVLEPVTARLLGPLEDALSAHFARFPVTVIDDKPVAHHQFSLEPMLAAAGLLADARVDAILWSGTAASWEGLDTDHALEAAIREATGVPATTSTLALLDAMRALGVQRYGLVVPYVPAIVDRIRTNLAGAGFDCAAEDHRSLTTNWEFAGVSAEQLAAAARRVAASEPDAIVIHCTNLRGAEVSEALERELGIPVLDSVVVGLWGALRLLDMSVPAAGFGSLAGISMAVRAPVPANA